MTDVFRRLTTEEGFLLTLRVLRRIAETDYRGHRSTEQRTAFEALRDLEDHGDDTMRQLLRDPRGRTTS